MTPRSPNPPRTEACHKRAWPGCGGSLVSLPIAILGSLLLTGCADTSRSSEWASYPTPEENAFLFWPKLPPDLKRVVVLPVACDPQRQDLRDARDILQPVLLSELMKTRKFEVIAVPPEILQTRTGRATWRGTEVLPVDLLSTLRELYGCDAVLFSELTAFRAYPPLAVGWRMRLVQVRDFRTLWAVDEVIDAGQPAVCQAAAWYQREHEQSPGDFDGSWAVIESPRRFGQYAAARVLASLPDR